MIQTRDKTSCRAWLAVGSVATGTFVMVTSEFMPIGLLSAIPRDLQVSDGQAGLLVTVPGAVAAVAAPAVTIAARKTDRRALLVALTALILVSNLVVALASSFPFVLIGRVLLGLSVGGFWAFAAAVGRRLVQEADGGRATAVILTGISVGTVLGVPIRTAVGDLAGWRAPFVGVAGLALAVLLTQQALLPNLPNHQAATVRDLGTLLRVPREAAGLAAAALIAGGHFAAYTYLEPFLTQVARMESVGVSWTLAGYGIAGVLGTIVGERATARDVRCAFLGVAMLMAASIFLSAALGSNPGWATLFVILWGAAFGAVPICVQIWTYEAAPKQFEVGSALMVTVFQVALAAGAFGGGLIVDKAGLVSAFAVGGSLSLLCGLLVSIVGREKPSSANPAF